MIIGRKSCSRTRSEWGRPCSPRLGEANARAVASRELGSASLHILGVASLPNKVKPALEWEATTVGAVQTPRGERRQRAQKEPAGTWETRFGVFNGQPLTGSHNRWRGRRPGYWWNPRFFNVGIDDWRPCRLSSQCRRQANDQITPVVPEVVPVAGEHRRHQTL
jgi:hypothetical protein